MAGTRAQLAQNALPGPGDTSGGSQTDAGALASARLAAAAPTLGPTSHQWNTQVPGITNDPVLASRLDQALAGVNGHIGAAVQDIGSGRGAVLNGDMELQSASLYKLPVLYTVFDLGLNMSEELTITDEALSYDSGTMELGPGETLSVAEAVERMVTLSDNTSAILLGSRVGAGNINANINSLGMQTTHYSLDRMTSSALDMLHFLELVARGKAVSPTASADMLHLMLRQRVNDRLPRLLPDNVQVAHKTGNLPGVVNDVGVMYGANSTVAVAVMVSDTTDETAAGNAIAQIGQIANNYFDQQPEVSDRPLIPPAPWRPIPPVWREPRPIPPTPTPPPEKTVAPRAEVETRLTPTLAGTAIATAVPTPAPATPTAAPTNAAAAVAAPTSAPTVKPTPQPPAPTATRVPPPPPTSTPVPVQVVQPTRPPVKPTVAPPQPTATLPPNRR